MDSLRIGFFTEVHRPVVNGVVAAVEGLAQGLRSRGHEVYCFAPRMPGDDGEGDVFFRMPSLPLPTRTPYRLTVPVVGRRSVRSVIKRLHIVHVHSPFITGWMGLRYARRYGMPVVYTYHTQLERYAHYVPFEPTATRFAAEALTRTFANSVDAVVVPTNAMLNRLRELGVNSRIAVVPSGIDVAQFGAGRRDGAMRAQLCAGSGPVALFVGRLAKEKSTDMLVRALAATQRTDLTLAIAGDGPEREELERLAGELRVTGQVRFLGPMQRDELPDVYASADAFVFPSTSETQGLVLAEALAAGLPVIAADAPQNRDVIGSAGKLVEPTVQAFSRALRELRPVAEDERSRARAAGSRFAIETQIDRMLSLYTSLGGDLTRTYVRC